MLDSVTLYAEGLVLHSGFIQLKRRVEEINYLHGARLSIYLLTSLCSRTVKCLPDSRQIVCILPGCFRLSGQTTKSPKTSLFQSSLSLISSGRTVGPGALETSFGSKTPSRRLLPRGQSRMLGVPL